jgi:hypothetical protein
MIGWLAERSRGKLGRVSDVTRVMEAIQQGDPKAANELLPLVYEELRKLAAARMANEAAGHTLQATALVHEAWLRQWATTTRTAGVSRHPFAPLDFGPAYVSPASLR